MHNEPFYKDGLQFECTKCGNCCTGFPGYVYLSVKDIYSIAESLKLDKVSFLKKYTRTIHVFGEKRLSLIENPPYDCIFWDKICTIYNVRPYQCRSFPFWKRILVSYREWEKAAHNCPGMNRGKVHSREEIECLLRNTPPYDTAGFPTSLQNEGR